MEQEEKPHPKPGLAELINEGKNQVELENDNQEIILVVESVQEQELEKQPRTAPGILRPGHGVDIIDMPESRERRPEQKGSENFQQSKTVIFPQGQGLVPELQAQTQSGKEKEERNREAGELIQENRKVGYRDEIAGFI